MYEIDHVDRQLHWIEVEPIEQPLIMLVLEPFSVFLLTWTDAYTGAYTNMIDYARF